MQITFYSISMALLWSALVITGMYFLRKNVHTIHYFNIYTLMLIYILCMVRMCLPVEFAYTQEIAMPAVYNRFVPFVYRDMQDIPMTPMELLFIPVGIVCVILLLRLSFQYFRSYLYIRTLAQLRIFVAEQDEMSACLQELYPQYAKKTCIICSSNFRVPMQMGLFRPVILMPPVTYDSKDLSLIIQHEMTHYQNRDTWIKLAVNIWSCIFWWFPFTYLLSLGMDESLELKCDYEVTKNMSSQDKAAYLIALLHAYQGKSDEQKLQKNVRNGKNSDKTEKTAVAFCKCEDGETIKKRFQYTIHAKKQYHITVPAIIVSLLLFIASYSVVFQSYEDWIPPDDGMTYFSNDNAFIYHRLDGVYELYIDGQFKEFLGESKVTNFRNLGMTVKEEGEEL